MANKPKIRFKGFDDAWEQRKVSEIAIEKLSNGIMNNQSDGETGVKHINVINMYDTDKIHPEKLAFSNYEEDAVKKCNVEFGDIFLTRSSLKPEGIAEANVLLNSGRFVYDDHLIRVKVNKEKYDPFFVKLNLSGNAFKRQFIVRAKTTAFTTIGQEDISECLGSFPKKEEQQQIGECFMVIDHLITLHQRKYLQKKKTSLTWEQRKLLSCIQSITDFRGRTPKKLGMDWSESGYLALSALNVKDGYIDFSQDVHYGNQELYDKWMSGKELHRGQVLFTTEAPMGNVAQVPDNKGYILSQRTIAFDVEEKILSENFLATLLRTPNVFNDLIALSSGGTAKGVSQKSLSGLDVVIPKNIDEQNKLADYFINLDNLITLHRRAHFHRRRRTYK